MRSAAGRVVKALDALEDRADPLLLDHPSLLRDQREQLLADAGSRSDASRRERTKSIITDGPTLRRSPSETEVTHRKVGSTSFD